MVASVEAVNLIGLAVPQLVDPNSSDCERLDVGEGATVMVVASLIVEQPLLLVTCKVYTPGNAAV